LLTLPTNSTFTVISSVGDKLLSDEDLVLLKRRIFAIKCNSLPPITTHNMADHNAQHGR
jgi:hypothetical protein